MWRHNKTAKKLNVFCSYRICGYNFDRLINALYRKKIKLFDIKKDGKFLFITVKGTDEQKLFAITEELCYNNIVKIKERGKSLIIPFLIRNIGIITGAVLLFISAVLFDNVLLDVNYTGTGKTEYQQIETVLYKKNIKRFSLFSDIDIPRLEDELLRETDAFSFISCKKNGNRLVVDATLNNQRQQIQNDNVEKIYAPFSGVVKSVIVYRGTALVSVGDRVNKGDLIVDGFMTVKELTSPCNVLAIITIEEEIEKVFFFDRIVDKNYVGMLAESLYEDADGKQIILNKENGKYKYVVKLYYNRRITE